MYQCSKPMPGRHGQICYSDGYGVWIGVLEIIKCHRHNKTRGTWRINKVYMYARIPRLHALAMEELPICSTRAISEPL